VPPPDLCVELPFEDPPTHIDVSFLARLRSADIVFLVDVTGSMGSEIDRIRSSLRDVIVPGLVRSIPAARLAVAWFADFPVDPYGDRGDLPFHLVEPLTDRIDRVQAAVDLLPLLSGSDEAESQIEALYQTATGAGRGGYVPPASCPDGTVGYPCFGPVGSRIVLLFTDANFHNDPDGDNPYYARTLLPEPATWDEALEALRGIGAKVLGLFSGLPDDVRARGDLERVCEATGAVDARGRPIVLDIGEAGENLDEGVVAVVETLVEEAPLDIDAFVEDWPGDDFDATALVVGIRTLRADPPSGATDRGDRFDDVRPGTRVWFRIELWNDLLPPEPETREILLTVVLRGDRVTRLQEVNVRILIPGFDDAGCDD
jgi:hypothetical protein